MSIAETMNPKLLAAICRGKMAVSGASPLLIKKYEEKKKKKKKEGNESATRRAAVRDGAACAKARL